MDTSSKLYNSRAWGIFSLLMCIGLVVAPIIAAELSGSWELGVLVAVLCWPGTFSALFVSYLKRKLPRIGGGPRFVGSKRFGRRTYR